MTVPELAGLRQSQWLPAILESELPGGSFQTRAQARTGCPGVAASSPYLLFEAGRVAGHRSSCGYGLARARVGNWLRQKRHSFRALSGRRQSWRRLAVTKAEQEHTNNAVRVAGLDRILFRTSDLRPTGDPPSALDIRILFAYTGNRLFSAKNYF